MKQKTYNLKITERELKDSRIRKHLLALVEMRVKLQMSQPKIVVSKVEFEFIRHHYSWRNVKDYLPEKKDRFKGEMGKYNGKRVVVRGMK